MAYILYIGISLPITAPTSRGCRSSRIKHVRKRLHNIKFKLYTSQFVKQFTAILDTITGTKTSHHDLNIVGYRRAAYVWTKGGKNVSKS